MIYTWRLNSLTGSFDMVVSSIDLAADVAATILPVANGGTGVSACAGTYTPALTNVLNCTSAAYKAQWSRDGAVVTVSGKLAIDPVAASAVQLGIGLPVASNLGVQEDCCGTAFAPGVAYQGGAILGDAANNRAELNFVAVDLTEQAWYYTFTYEVI